MKHYVITIARGFGSGGKEIGTKLAAKLGIPCYENQLLRMASDYSGINENLFQKADEKLSKVEYVLKHLNMIPFTTVATPRTEAFISNNNLFNIQSKIIKELAWAQSCVIVGKCADYVLREHPKVISVYIEAPREACLERIMGKLGVTEKEAHWLIETTDKHRADYYEYYTHGGSWTNPVNYDMTLNSAKAGSDNCVEMILHYMKLKWGDFNNASDTKGN